MTEDEVTTIEICTTESTDNCAQNLLRSWYSRNECLQLQRHSKHKETSRSCKTNKESNTFQGFITCPLAHSLGSLSSKNSVCYSKNGQQALKPTTPNKSKMTGGKSFQSGNKETIFQHNMPAGQMLQEYREKHLYTRSRLMKAQKQVSMIAQEGKSRSFKLEKQSSKQNSAENSPNTISSEKSSSKENQQREENKTKSQEKKKIRKSK
ncbi:hypothetical protein L9F63_010791 [Diploptera punctata]|uniref:Uncharacterized protein n=1 Tax=Diploptera punctata TaxID=6984 RepID=A0AAD8AG84_DIPPU|nr:hypothetical protein L9F63_010791 [Diploptera punctata]